MPGGRLGGSFLSNASSMYDDLEYGFNAFAEPALALGSGALAEIGGGWAGLGAMPGAMQRGEDPLDAFRMTSERVQDRYTYQPQTAGGQAGMQAIGRGAQYVMDSNEAQLIGASAGRGADWAIQNFPNAAPPLMAAGVGAAAVLDPTKGRARAAGRLRPMQAAEFGSSGKKQLTQTDRSQFSGRLNEARESMDAQGRAQVSPLDDDFSGRVFTTDDGKVGFTIDDDGYVGNVFKHADADVSDVMGAALTKARAEGGRNLDAFDTYLSSSYANRGAVETGRSPWNPEYATPEMVEGLPGKPDYVAMDIGGVVPERKHSLLAGPREQVPLERVVPPRGEPPKIPPMFQGGKVPRLKNFAEAGMEEGAQNWYHLGGLKDKFIEELGPEAGAQKFDRFMDMNAAMSPMSKVDAQIKRAGILYNREAQGLPISPLTHEMFPPGYGHIATTSAHKPAIGRLVDEGAVGTPLAQPKISSFAENLKGNYEPLTVDRHNMRIISGADKAPTSAQYPFMESRQSKIAEQMDLQPAEFQAALWTGASDITGVADSRNMTAMMNQRIAKTAEELGIPEEEALKRFIRGDTYLRSLVLGTGAAGGAGALMQDDDQAL